MKYSIIIPTYNHCDDLLKPCIDSVLANTLMQECELIVVANGCTDNTKWYLERLDYQFKSLGFGNHFKIVWHDSPLGFSKACNQGIQASIGQKLILLNNDVVLLPQSVHTWLERLNRPFEQESNVGITSTLKLHSKETGRDFAVFFCVMIDRKVINTVGLLNEEFGVGGGEDIEYCLLAEQAGFKVVGVAQTQYSSELATNTSDFPIWHKAEGTMHDPQLVPNWSEIFQNNMNKLARKYQHPTVYQTADQAAAVFSWLAETDEESDELFREVFVDNIYRTSSAELANVDVIDVGANQGMFSILTAVMGANHVVCAEPISSSFAKLQKNIDLCKITNKISAVQRAVVGKPTAPISMGINQKSGHNSFYKPGSQTEIVATVTLEQLTKDCHNNIFLKLDCEGAEYDILIDSADHVFDKITTIAVEIHHDLHPVYKGPEPVRDRLTQLGYSNVIINQIGTWWSDANGNRVRFDPLPLSVEKWTKLS